MATHSSGAGNRLRRVATSAAVAPDATTTRALAQQQRLVIATPKPTKLLYSIVINNHPSFCNRPPTPLPNHIPHTRWELVQPCLARPHYEQNLCSTATPRGCHRNSLVKTLVVMQSQKVESRICLMMVRRARWKNEREKEHNQDQWKRW